MKKISFILLLLTIVNVYAQKKTSKKNQFSTEQKAQLRVKKLTNKLELSPKQSAKITPLIVANIQERIAHKKNGKKNNRNISADEKFQMAMARLDKQAELQERMKDILNKNQYAQWKKMQNRHEKKAKMHKKKAQKMIHSKKDKKTRNKERTTA